MGVAKPVGVQPEVRGEAHDQREVVGAGAWLVSSFIALSLANYVFSLAMSRLLSIEDYGSFGVVSSILLLEGLVATSGFPWLLSTLISRNEGAEREDVRARALGAALVGNAALGAVTGGIIALTLAGLIARHPLVPLLIAITAFATCVNAVWYGLEQGERRFPLLAGLRSGEAIIKVVFGTGLVVAGLGLEGAVGGSAVAACCMAVWGATRVRSFAWPRRGSWLHIHNPRALGWTGAAQLGLALLMNIDILAVRGLGIGPNAAAGAGYYQAAVVLARAPVLVGLAVLSAGFPFLARGSANPQDERKLVSMMARVLALGPLPIAIVLAAAPKSAIAFFFPPSYAPAVRLLQLTAITAFPLIVLSGVVTTLQATEGMKRAALAVIPAAIIESILLVVLVPRVGPLGAAWASLIAASAGAGVSLLVAPRGWTSPTLSRLAPIIVGWTVLCTAAMMIPITPKLWIFEAAALYTLFLLVVWLFGGLSFAELILVVPNVARTPIRTLANYESRLRRW